MPWSASSNASWLRPSRRAPLRSHTDDRSESRRGSAAPAGFDDVLAEFLAEAGSASRRRRLDREQRFAEALAATAPTVTADSLTRFVGERISVGPVDDLVVAGDDEICYLKINHGFWEQLYAIFGPADPTRMRIREPGLFRHRYIASGFLEALAAAIGLVARSEGDRLVFPGLHFGVSLASGTHDHPEVLAGFPAREPREQRES